MAVISIKYVLDYDIVLTFILMIAKKVESLSLILCVPHGLSPK